MSSSENTEETLNELAEYLNDLNVGMRNCQEHYNDQTQENYNSAHYEENEVINKNATEEKPAKISSVYRKLEKQLKLFKESPEFSQIEKYEKDLKKKLDQELEDLDYTMKETKATVENIIRLKKQKFYVKKELSKMTKNLSKFKQEELKEMELVVAVYDKDLLRRWHLMKKTNSPHTLEGFLNNVIGKRQSIDFIYTMAKERLEFLKKKGTTSNLPALEDKVINEIQPSKGEDDISED